MFNLPSFTLPWSQPRPVETAAAPAPIGRSQNGSGKPTTHSKRRKARRKASRR